MSTYIQLKDLPDDHDLESPDISKSYSFNPKGSTTDEVPSTSTDVPSVDLSITTASIFKDLRLVLLAVHGTVAACWGVALLVFVVVRVPMDWNISQGLQTSPGIINTVVALIATASTAHIKYLLQQTIGEYSRGMLVRGFVLGDLRWMQGVQQMSLFTKFPDRNDGGRFKMLSKGRMMWIIVYGGFALHASSLVAILQPHVYFKNVLFNDPVPCGLNSSDLTLDVDPFLTGEQQQYIDSFSFNVGAGLATFQEQVNGNTTTTVAGRIYKKDSYSYGAVGGLRDGLQQLPGVLFSAQCTENPPEALSVWQSTFPNGSLPVLAPLPDGSLNFTDMPVPPGLGRVMSDVAPFNLSSTRAALYALVAPSGDGALFSTILRPQSTDEIPLLCSWKALPKLVQVQMVNYTVRTLSDNDTDVSPSLVGRATLKTLEGMALMARVAGATIQQGAADPNTPKPVAFQTYYRYSAPLSKVLETLLADGGKASITAYNINIWGMISQTPVTQPVPALCRTLNRTVAEHWRFGNTNNLGWIAIIWTAFTGLLAIFVAWLMNSRARMAQVNILETAQAFALGRDENISEDKILRVSDGRVIIVEQFQT